MVARRRTAPEPEPSNRRPGTTPESRENQLISLAYDTAEKQMLAGTASAQVITAFLKLGSSRERLEQERLGNENVLLEAKAEQIKSQQKIEELYEKAISAMRAYSGAPPEEGLDPYED